MNFKSTSIFFVLLLVSILAKSQDPTRFQSEIDKLTTTKHLLTDSNDVLLFTGSSSIRMWKTLQNYFGDYYTINNGFGGSHMSDLLYYSNELIHSYESEIIFLYEGDNDIAARKGKKEILKSTKKLLKEIKKKHPESSIVLIAAKPSPSRWQFKEEYEELNSSFAKLAKKKRVYYADVWTPMLDNKGTVLKDIFIEDQLHMNKAGYDIWGKVINDLLKKIYE